MNAGEATGPELSEAQMQQMLHDHNEAFLREALSEYEKDPDQNARMEQVPVEMKPFVKTGVEQSAASDVQLRFVEHSASPVNPMARISSISPRTFSTGG